MAQSDIEYPGWRFRFWPRRKAEAPEGLTSVLAPYQPLSRSWFKRILGLSGLMLFCLIYGFFFSVFVPTYFAFFMFPVMVLGLLVIWALPDINWAPTRTLEWLFYATFISLIVWPDYLAIALPGLPWITLLRLTSFPLVLVLLICLSMSGEFRKQLLQSLSTIPAIPILLGIFVVIQFYSIGLSKDITGSIQKFIVAQTTWTAAFFAAAYVFRKPGQIRRWALISWVMAIFVSLIAIWEFRIGRLPWVGHIPSFLKIDDENVASILSPKMRAGTSLYRAQSTFTTPLGLAEYLALTLPFVLHFTTSQFSQKIRVAAACSIPLLLVSCYLTNAKLGTVGCLFGIVLYVFGAAYRRWRRDKHSLVAAATLFGYPVGIGMLAAAMLASHRFQVMILGNDGSHDASTDTRIQQYTIGLQKFLEWPFGYGIGQAAATINPGVVGRVTIDTYYLSIVLEYGIAGFIVFYGMFAIAIFESCKRSLLAVSPSENKAFLLPLAVSLVVFIVIKSVFSQQDNHPMVFMMLGALMALAIPQQKPSASRKSKASNGFHQGRPAPQRNGSIHS